LAFFVRSRRRALRPGDHDLVVRAVVAGARERAVGVLSAHLVAAAARALERTRGRGGGAGLIAIAALTLDDTRRIGLAVLGAAAVLAVEVAARRSLIASAVTIGANRDAVVVTRSQRERTQRENNTQHHERQKVLHRPIHQIRNVFPATRLEWSSTNAHRYQNSRTQATN